MRVSLLSSKSGIVLDIAHVASIAHVVSTLIVVSLTILTLAGGAAASTIQSGPDLQAAVDSAFAGDTVLVPPGVYDKVVIDKSLSLVADGAVIKTGPLEACVKVLADGVSISGFTVRDGLYGIYLKEVRGCTLTNNTVIHCRQPGISLLASDDNLVAGNNASFNGLGGEGWYGIYLSNSNGNVIEDNVASNNGAYGINLFPSCSNNTIRGNVLENNMYGLYMFTDCANNLIEENVMSRNTASGLDMRFNCHDNMVRNNTMEDNAVVGAYLLDSGKNAMEGNVMSSNEMFGIQIQGGEGENAMVNNNITGSRTGIFVDSDGNRAFGNRLRDNVIQVEDRGQNIWNAPYPVGGNFWADYGGVDQFSGPGQDVPGADGFGDSPYQVSDGSEDVYPAMGERFVPIRVVEAKVTPARARVGDSVLVSARMDSTYAITQVSVRAPGSQAGYARMVPTGDGYQGTLATALFEPGTYELVLTATDRRGYELEESIGEFELISRTGRDFDAAMTELGKR